MQSLRFFIRVLTLLIVAAIGFGRDEVTPFLRDGVMIGCENSQSSVTLSGNENAVMETIAQIQKERPEIFVRRLKVAMAYHSREHSHLAQNISC